MRSYTPHPLPPDVTNLAPSRFERDDLDVRELILVARRFWRWVAYPACLCLLLGAGYLLLAPSSYTATARLLINPNRAAGSGETRPDSTIEKAYLDTQVEVLSSQQLSEIVVHDHGLTADSELASQGWRALLPQWLEDALPARGGAQADPAVRAFDAVVTRFHDRTRVSRVGATYIVDVSFTASSPERAAAFANAVCETFIAGQRAEVKDAFSRSSAALDQEISRLQAKAADADRAAEDYRVRHDLLESSGDDQAERQLADLNQQWIIAQSESGQAQDRLDQARAVTVDDIVQSRQSVLAEVPNLAVINELARSLASVRSGPPDAASLGLAPEEFAGRVAALSRELAKAVRFYQDACALAKSHETSLRRDLAAAYVRQNRNAAQKTHLQDLETQVATLRSLYNDRIKRRFEMQPQEQTQELAAAVVGSAKPPLDRSSPRAIFVLGITGLLGSVVGGGAAFVRHQLDDSLHTSSEAEDVLGLRCLGVLPLLASSRRSQRGRAGRRAAGQSGQLGRTLHTIRSALDLYSTSHGAKIVGVISALPQEGRTTLVTRLDRYLSGLGDRVLRVCIDAPLGVAAAGPTQLPPLSSAKQPNPESAIRVIHFPEDDGQPHDPLAGARRLQSVLESFAGLNDYIVIDLPACTASIGILDAALVVDCFVLVVAAGRTSRATIIEALKANRAIADRLLGVVLT